MSGTSSVSPVDHRESGSHRPEGHRPRLRVKDSVPAWAIRYRAADFPPFGYAADVVGLALDLEAGTLDALVVERGTEGPFPSQDAWPGGFVEWQTDADARVAALRELQEETGQSSVDYLEALDTYDANGRDPRQWAGYPDQATGRIVATGVRVVSKAWLALLRKAGRVLRSDPREDAVAARWVSVYHYLPWEDLRTDAGRRLRRQIVAALERWATIAPTTEAADVRRLRVRELFGDETGGELRWNEERAADRFRLLLEARLVDEAWRDRWGQLLPAAAGEPRYGQALAFDHRQMLADALSRLRGKVKYVPATLAALLPAPFTLKEMALACEAIGGRPLYQKNFARLVSQTTKFRLVTPTLGTRQEQGRRGPPAQLYTYQEPVAFRRLDPSLALPWAPLPAS